MLNNKVLVTINCQKVWVDMNTWHMQGKKNNGKFKASIEKKERENKTFSREIEIESTKKLITKLNWFLESNTLILK